MVVCIECGRQSNQQLFKKYTGGAIQLIQCEACHKVIDKYVEFDVVILLLDVLLLRIQSYRHLIFNYNISPSLLWKLSIVLVLCEAYTKLRRLGLQNPDSVVLQVNFHTFFIQSAIETIILFLIFYVLFWSLSSPTFIDILRVLVISSYGKLSAIAAMVWTGDFYLWLPLVFLIPTQFQALRASLPNVSMVRAAAMVLVLNTVPHGASFLLDKLRTAVVEYILGEQTSQPFLS